MSATVEIGIDLGTTNSVVARMTNGQVEIIKNRNAEITPSFVAYDSRGSAKVGQPAYAQFADPNRGQDVHAEFKRVMGQDIKLLFSNCDKVCTPEELSSLILQDMRRAVGERYGEEPRSAVITVPAMFELPQNEATARAAKLAGFQESHLLQEPVAAAMAYGMSETAEKSLWLIFDYGGGTFDTSLISVRDGAMSVVKHAGDNYLGGADFDWAIVDEILLPTIGERFRLGNLKRHESKHRESVGRLRRLKRLAETLKVDLSRAEQVTLFADAGEVFDDDDGNPIVLDLKVDRERFNSLIESKVDKAVGLASALIRESGFGPSDISRVVLVGGSTFVPIVRDRLGALGAPLSMEIDPMTVVARGAAVYASTLAWDSSPSTASKPTAGQATVKLEYERMTKQMTPLVGGRVTLNGAPPAPGSTITITRDDEGFTTGSLTIDGSGMFFANVQTRETGQSVFRLDVRDQGGGLVPVQPESFAITQGLSVGKATLPSGFLVALDDGSAAVLVAGGASLPARAERDVHTSRELRAKSTDQIKILFLSGDDPKADHNLAGMQIVISGANIQRDLPKGSKIELSVEIDASGVPHPRAFVERLDEEFEPDNAGRSTVIEHELPEVMRRRVLELRRRMDDLDEKVQHNEDTTIATRVRGLRQRISGGQVEQLIQAWEEGDRVSAGQARSELVQMAKDVDELDTVVSWPAKVVEFGELRGEVREVLADLGQPDMNEAFDTIAAEGKRAIDAHDPKMLEASITILHQVRFEALQRDPRFWVGMLQFCASRMSEFPDQIAAKELLSEGAMAMRRDDVDSLRSICRELMQQLPSDVAAMAQSSVIRSDVM